MIEALLLNALLLLFILVTYLVRTVRRATSVFCGECGSTRNHLVCSDCGNGEI